MTAQIYKEPCSKCDGKTRLDWAQHVMGGICFRCKGTGYFTYKTSPEARAMAREKAEQRRERKRIEAIELEKDANESAGYGRLTNWEIQQDARVVEAHGVALIINQRRDALSHYGEMIRDGKRGFCDSIAESLENGSELYGRGLTIATEILAKNISGSRKNSKAYYEALEKIVDDFETVAQP